MPHPVTDVSTLETDIWPWWQSGFVNFKVSLCFPKAIARILQRTEQTTNQKRYWSNIFLCLPTVKSCWVLLSVGNKLEGHNDSCLVNFEVWVWPFFSNSQWIFPLWTMLMPFYKTSLKKTINMKCIVIFNSKWNKVKKHFDRAENTYQVIFILKSIPKKDVLLLGFVITADVWMY